MATYVVLEVVGFMAAIFYPNYPSQPDVEEEHANVLKLGLAVISPFYLYAHTLFYLSAWTLTPVVTWWLVLGVFMVWVGVMVQ